LAGWFGAIFAANWAGRPEKPAKMAPGATKDCGWCFVWKAGILIVMRLGRKLMFGLALNAALVIGAQADNIRPANNSSSGPYHTIMDRNVFQLVAPPVVKPVAPPPPAPPNVKLIGLMEISGHAQGLFSISDPTAPGKVPIPVMMSVNERQSGVEVKEIDIKAKCARIQVGDNISMINLDEPKGMSGGPGLAPAGPGPGMGMGLRSGGYPPTQPAMPTAAAGYPSPSLPGAYNPEAGAGANAAAGGVDMGGGADALPTRQVRAEQEQAVQQQLYNMEIQRQAALEQNDPRGLMLPVTAMTPDQTLPLIVNQQKQLLGQSDQGPTSSGNTQQQTSGPTVPGSSGPSWGGPIIHGTPTVPGGH
jgi:hypothetical protein